MCLSNFHWTPSVSIKTLCNSIAASLYIPSYLKKAELALCYKNLMSYSHVTDPSICVIYVSNISLTNTLSANYCKNAES